MWLSIISFLMTKSIVFSRYIIFTKSLSNIIRVLCNIIWKLILLFKYKKNKNDKTFFRKAFSFEIISFSLDKDFWNIVKLNTRIIFYFYFKFSSTWKVNFLRNIFNFIVKCYVYIPYIFSKLTFSFIFRFEIYIW